MNNRNQHFQNDQVYIRGHRQAVKQACRLSPPGGSPLPDADRSFLDIAIDPGAGTATMAILGEDRQTVNYLLTNGVITDTGIYFHAEYPLPPAVTVPWITSGLTSALPCGAMG